MRGWAKVVPRTAAHQQLAGDPLYGEVPWAAEITGGRERRAMAGEDRNFTVAGCPVCYGCRICRCVSALGLDTAVYFLLHIARGRKR